MSTPQITLCVLAPLQETTHLYKSKHYNTINRTFKRTINNAIMITANDLKTRGVKAIEEQLQDADRVGITVRGKLKYVAVTVEQYDLLREAEITAAYHAVMKDYKEGRYTTSVEDHFKELEDEVQ